MLLNCSTLPSVAPKTRDNSGTSPSDLFQQLKAKRQQRPETPALIRRIHTSSSHLAPHQCSDSAEEWIKPGSNQPLRHRTAPPATPVATPGLTTLDAYTCWMVLLLQSPPSNCNLRPQHVEDRLNVLKRPIRHRNPQGNTDNPRTSSSSRDRTRRPLDNTVGRRLRALNTF